MDGVIFSLALSLILLSYMTLWYGLATYIRRLDIVDTAWGLGFVLVAWVSLAIRHNFGAPQLVIALLVSLWGGRLAWHISRRNIRKTTEDARYQALREKWGSRTYKAYTNVFLLQGVLIGLVSLPVIAIACSSRPLNIGCYLGWVVWAAGIAFEAVADWQLARFIAHRKPGSHAVMDRGLWRYSRHPNYFGEVTAWWGAAIVAISVGKWWGSIGALLITFLIVKVSGIPPLEKRYAGNSDYAAYRERTSVFFPLPTRGKG